MKGKSIFSNNFTLVFKNEEIHSLYHQKIISTLRTKCLLLFLFLLQVFNISLLFLLLNYELFVTNLEKEIEKNCELIKIKYYVLCFSAIPFSSFILFYIKSSYPKVSFLFDYTIYFSYLIITDSTNYEFLIWIKAISNEYMFINYSLNIFFNILYATVFECSFLKIFTTNVIWIVLISTSSSDKTSISFFFYISKFAMTFFTYFLERNFKKSFYYNFKLERKCELLDSILNNMQSGVFINEIEEIKFMNLYGKEKLSFLFNSNTKSRESLSICSKSRFDDFSLNFPVVGYRTSRNTIREDIFSNLLDINPEISSKFCEMFSSMTYREICCFITNNDFFRYDFKYLGKKEFKENEVSRYLEIYLRVNHKNLKKYIEFIFHDVTKTKEIEETKVQSKYQSMFLSKVAHEFKNPLIGVISLIDGIRENHLKKETSEKNLGLIENLCMYMILLVKDFEIISEINNTKKILLHSSVYEIRDEMEKLKNITLTLLETISKSHLNQICFNLEISEDTPSTIDVDKFRLNQIILNLLTNSIKFTQNGYITLRISTESINFEKIITFSVIDSGIGITEELKKDLFNRFVKKEVMNNDSGQGLGLYLVETLCSKMKSKIEYKSNYPRGSIFYFSISICPSRCNSEETVLIEKYNPLKPNNESNVSLNSINSAYISQNIQDDRSKNISKSFGLEMLNRLERDSKTIEDNYRIPTISQYENNNTTVILDERPTVRIMVVDDDNFVRKSTIRVIIKYTERYLPQYKIEILEASDGIECLYMIYNSTILNRLINFIIMDQTMKFINGSYCSDIIYQMFVNNCIKKIPVFIVTAFEQSTSKTKFDNKVVEKVYSKPFTSQMLTEIISMIKFDCL
jgi:signal transduction histidine kinase/CheY-like chemotaxis protein